MMIEGNLGRDNSGKKIRVRNCTKGWKKRREIERVTEEGCDIMERIIKG
jgi:hypothetical protein